jgi:hypothetical protein
MAATPTATNITNPLDFPRYVRSLRPSLPESLPNYVDDELEKVSQSLQTLEEAANNHANAKVEEERFARVTEDEAIAGRIVTVEANFNTAVSQANARITTEEIARANAVEAVASRVTEVEASYKKADSEALARVSVEELARATADEALAARIETVQADYKAADANTQASVVREAYARATKDEALASQITTVTANYQAADAINTAAISNEATARANADSALATQISSVSATANSKNKTFYQSSAPTASATGDLWFDTANGNKPFRWSGTAWDPVDDGRIAVNTAAITSEQTARANADSALAADITTVGTTVAGHTSTLTTYGTSINGLQAKYGVKLDVNGYVSGFEQNNGSGTSDFVITADKFKIVMPGTPGATPVVPFTVTSGLVQINGNLIVTGTITNSQLANLAVETAKIANNAVTALSYSYTEGETSYITSEVTWVDQQTLTVSSTGAPAKISMGVLTKGDTPTNMALRLLRDSTVLIEDMYAFASPGVTDSLFYEIVDTPPSSGSYTYKLQARKVNIADDNSGRTCRRYLASLELKK